MNIIAPLCWFEFIVIVGPNGAVCDAVIHGMGISWSQYVHRVIHGGRHRVALRDVVNHGVAVIGSPCVEMNVYAYMCV